MNHFRRNSYFTSNENEQPLTISRVTLLKDFRPIDYDMFKTGAKWVNKGLTPYLQVKLLGLLENRDAFYIEQEDLKLQKVLNMFGSTEKIRKTAEHISYMKRRWGGSGGVREKLKLAWVGYNNYEKIHFYEDRGKEEE